MQLPPEVEEEILIHTSPKDLINLCSSSKGYYALCSDKRFWLRRFRAENIPTFFLKKMVEDNPFPTPTQYARVYESSVLAKDYSSLYPYRHRQIEVPGTTPPYIFNIPGIEETQVVKYNRIAALNENIGTGLASLIKRYEPLASELEYPASIGGLEDCIENWYTNYSVTMILEVGTSDFLIIEGEGDELYNTHLNPQDAHELLFRMLVVNDLARKKKIPGRF